MGDLGINATTSIIENLKKQVEEKRIKDPAECKKLLIDSIKQEMTVGNTEYEFENRKSVILVIGVNGVGKTTSVGKLAVRRKDQGKKVILAAADTFRAAAGEQLVRVGEPGRRGVDWRTGQGQTLPLWCLMQCAAAKARNADILLCDTAGRLHNKKNLMEELRKIYRILEKEYPEAYLGNSCSVGRDDRAECFGAGEAVCGGGESHRYHFDEAGRNGQRGNCCRDSLGIGYSSKIHWRRRRVLKIWKNLIAESFVNALFDVKDSEG